jgi:hypothetical protein
MNPDSVRLYSKKKRFFRLTRIFAILGSVSLLAGLVLSFANLSAMAASGPEGQALLQETLLAETPACTPPEDWDRTVRLFRGNPSKEWTFNVAEPEMDVTLEIIYYQDYDRFGCPFDCSSPGNCQLNETAEGETPFGPVVITDGHEGADGGVERLRGRLEQGSYTVTFRFTGGSGSVNVGVRVRTESVATETPLPTDTPLPELTATPTETPVSEATPTPTETGIPQAETPSPTPTSIITVVPPAQTASPVPTETEPPDPTATPTSEVTVVPPAATDTPPATMAPPAGATRTPALAPATGGDFSGPQLPLSSGARLLINLGIVMLGLALVSYGLGQLNPRRE